MKVLIVLDILIRLCHPNGIIITSICFIIVVSIFGHPWHRSSTLDCRSSGRAINPASGAWLIPKFISIAQVVYGPVLQYSAELWPRIISFVQVVQYSLTVQNRGLNHSLWPRVCYQKHNYICVLGTSYEHR